MSKNDNSDPQMRRVLRMLFTKEANALKDLLKEPDVPLRQVNINFEALTVRYNKLCAANDDVLTSMMVESCSDEDLSEELTQTNRYDLVYLELKEMVKAIHPSPSYSQPIAQSSVLPVHVCEANSAKFTRPKLEIKKFDGQLRNWVQFWTQFCRHHNDESLSDDDKFELLLQYLEPDSPAYKTIEKYPPSGQNYHDAVELLRSRYGKDELLIEFYMRELLGLVLRKEEDVPLTKLYDDLEGHLRALQSFGITKDKCAAMVFPLVESAVPEEVFKVWERHRVQKSSSMKDPDACLTELLNFLKLEVEGEQRQNLRRVMLGKPETQENGGGAGKASPTLVTAEKFKNQCIFCDRSTHSSQDCAIAADAPLEQRLETVKKKNACFKCLRRGHVSSKCKIYMKCPVCKGRHFALLCEKICASEVVPNPSTGGASTSAAALTPFFKPIQVTYLQTLIARIKVGDNDRQLVRILCDSGSQRSYILRSCAVKAGLKPVGRVTLSQELFGGSKTSLKSHNHYQLVLKDLSGEQKCKIRVLEADKICEGVPRLHDDRLYHLLKNKGVELSDFSGLHGDVANEIHVLLGADVWAQLVTPEFMRVTEDVTAIRTTLGWTLVGSLQEHDSSLAMQCLVTLTCNSRLPDLWELEAMGIGDSGVQQSKEETDRQVMQFFESTVQREPSGRYVVRLPWLDGNPTLDSNFDSAKNRLLSTTKKLNNTGRYSDYDQVFQEWLQLGIIEKVESTKVAMKVHYLPHRPVFKEGSTTKTRPVFDASNKDKNGRSLNDCLATGPNLIELLPFVLTNFRLKKIGLVADVEKAFLQISIQESERDMLRFLWWEKGETTIFRHRRVVFGVCCSPFLLASVLNHHLSHTLDSHGKIARELRHAFYVDNCLTGVSEEGEIESFIKGAQDLLQQAGFNLRGWVNPLASPEHIEKVLGLEWHCGLDRLGCSVQPSTICHVTRQVILSTAHRVFDPMGFWAPFTLLPKILLQKTWQLKVDWNEALPEEITEPFYAWVKQLDELKLSRIPRHLVYNQSSVLHVFVDASQQGYAACIFLRTEAAGEVHIGLVLAKSKVAPLRKLTLPRLELMAAWLGAKLSQLARRCLKVETIPVCYWSDAAVVLAWLARPGSWGVFVENRVRDIHALTNGTTWRHVPGVMNPADLLSRGCSAEQLAKSHWWEGPPWLQKPHDEWPVKEPEPDPMEVEKEKRRCVVVACGLVANSLLGQLAERFLSYTKIVRTIAFILRLRAESFRKIPEREVYPQEFEEAEKKLLLWIQEACFLNEGSRNNELKNLEIFRDGEGFFRMKSRIVNASDAQAYTYPIILPANHPVVDRMVEEFHRVHRHVGTQTLLLLLRERFWLIRGRKTVARIIRRCVICRRYQAKALETPLPPLPEDRTRLGKVFQVTGTDLAGPLLLKGGEKCWIVIYTCATYRAVHLELITSLSSVAYAQALRRFIARRGRMEILYSDNGTNFTGLSGAMNQLDWGDMSKFCGMHQIKWKFNPPTASWWGGFWERLIRILKDLLYKNLRHASLNYEEMNTFLCECEYIMNNRPLTYVSEDGLELQPLRPSMFLQDLSDGDTLDLDQIQAVSLIERWKYLQTIRTHLRSRFRREYLGFLRSNVKTQRGSIRVGDIVLIGNENQKRVDWPLARVMKIMPGKDEVTRLAILKTSSGVLTRPVQRLYPLEVRHEDDLQPDVPNEDVPRRDRSSLEEEGPSTEVAQSDDYMDDAHSEEEMDELQRATEDFSAELPRCSRSGRLIKKRDLLDL